MLTATLSEAGEVDICDTKASAYASSGGYPSKVVLCPKYLGSQIEDHIQKANNTKPGVAVVYAGMHLETTPNRFYTVLLHEVSGRHKQVYFGIFANTALLIDSTYDHSGCW